MPQTFTFSFSVSSGPAAASVFTPVVLPPNPDGTPGVWVAPVPPGTKIGTVTVSPADWIGGFVIAAPFLMSGNDVVVGPVALAPGKYDISGYPVP